MTSPDGRFSLSLRARLQLDAASYSEATDLSSGAITRRAYLGVEGRAFQDFWYEYRMDFGGSRLGLSDPFINVARLAYVIGDTSGESGHGMVRINAGLIKPILTYEDSVSSASLTFLERAAAVNVATSAYGGGIPRLGAELTFQHAGVLHDTDNLLVSGALTGGDPSSRNPAVPHNITTEGAQLVGRLVYRLSFGDDFGIQLGGSGSQIVRVAGSPAQGTRTIDLQEYPELRVNAERLVNTGPIAADGGRFWSLEEIANVRNLYFAGEYFHYHIDRDTTCSMCIAAPDPEFSGWHVDVSWMLTGETKLYQADAANNNVAIMSNPHVARPVDAGGWGAWELAVRYSDLDLDWHPGLPGTACSPLNGCVRGGEQKIWTFGVNWYLTDNVRMLFDYMIIDVDRLNAAGQQAGQEVRAFGTRLQLTN